MVARAGTSVCAVDSDSQYANCFAVKDSTALKVQELCLERLEEWEAIRCQDRGSDPIVVEIAKWGAQSIVRDLGRPHRPWLDRMNYYGNTLYREDLQAIRFNEFYRIKPLTKLLIDAIGALGVFRLRIHLPQSRMSSGPRIEVQWTGSLTQPLPEPKFHIPFSKQFLRLFKQKC